jgi:hypothetical protein
MARLCIYTVHINPSLPHPYEEAEFVKEGFSLMAFFFTALWALYHRLWPQALGIAAFNGGLLYLLCDDVFAIPGYLILHLGLHLFVGLEGTEWLRARLKDRGYITVDITTGDSQLRAEQRYFDRHFAARPTPVTA